MTEAEFTHHYLQGIKPVKRNVSTSHHHKIQGSKIDESVAIPDEINWHQRGKVSTPGDQKGCGSCWAWTTASTMESLAAIHLNLDKPPKYSV